MLEAVLLKLHVKLASGWVLIRVNFDPMQEIGQKVGGGRSFVSGPLSVRLRYKKRVEVGRCTEEILRWFKYPPENAHPGCKVAARGYRIDLHHCFACASSRPA